MTDPPIEIDSDFAESPKTTSERFDAGMPPPPPPPARAPEAGAPTPPPLPKEQAWTAPPTPPERDRVVVLGRTQAGKTVFMSRLYEQLWNSRTTEVHMRALSGVPHVNLMKMIESMRGGRWPDATIGQQFVDVEVSYNGRKFRMTLLDYPGEIFSKAFVRGELDSPDTAELVEHIDRAAGVLLLVDPQNAVDSRDRAKQADDDFGMQQVVHRIRGFPGGAQVPISIVLTKCDQRNDLIRSLGGLDVFAKTYLFNLLRPAGKFCKLWKSVAVWTRTSRRTGESVPDLEKEPLNLVQPLTWLLQMMIESQAQRGREIGLKEREEEFRKAVADALRLVTDMNMRLQERVSHGSAKVARASALAQQLGLADDPSLAEARTLLAQLHERSESRREGGQLLLLWIGLAIIIVAVVWITLALTRDQS